MVISGIETVGFVPVVAGVPEFGATSWFGKIREEGKYDKVPSGIKLSRGSEIGAGHLFSFEFTTVDITGFDANNSANDFANDIEGGFEFWCFAYGLSNVLWREAVTPVISFNRDNKSGELKSITFKMSVHRGSNADIKAGANLLRDEVANASYATTNWTLTDASMLASQAASGGFTTAIGNCYKLTPTAASNTIAELKTDNNKFPVYVGQKFSIIFDGYVSGDEAGFDVNSYDESDVLQATTGVTSSNALIARNEVVITDADSKYMTISLIIIDGVGVGEFNRLFLGFGGASRGYSET